jgi:hypothetical protein
MIYMRRFAFYFPAGLMTFAAGVLFSTLFTHQRPGVKAVKPGYDLSYLYTGVDTCSPDKPSRNIALSEQKIAFPNTKGKIACADKYIMPVLAELNRDKDNRDPLESYVSGREMVDCRDMFDVSEQDLNGDGVNEAFVTATVPPLCGHGSNCQAWVVGHTAEKYKVILSDAQVENIDVDKGTFGGYKNLQIYGEAGGAAHLIRSYRFERGEYEIYKCIEEKSVDNGNNILKPLKPSECE